MRGKKNMSSEETVRKDTNLKIITTQEIVDTLKATNLSTKVANWLESESTYLADLINVYVEDPDTYGLHEDLRRNPLLILRTILYSADVLYQYQESYNNTLTMLAKANAITYSNLGEIPELLQNTTMQREKPKVLEHLKSGGNVAIGLMGSGASGKGTIGKRTGMQRVVNYTTRLKRPGEEQGKDYYYIREMVAGLGDTLDIDTGFNVLENAPQTNKPVYEIGKDGQPINYFEKYGPYITTVHRPGRAKHGTSVNEFKKHYDVGAKAIFFEHGPIQVQEAGEKLPSFIENAKVFPVCVLPPKTGIIPLALRIAVRTYGDKDHQDTTITNGYKIQESYLESTIGIGQIEELAWTNNFTKGKNPLGIAYIVNDKLGEAVGALQFLIAS